LSEASSFRLGKCDDFLALERQPAVFLFVIFFFLMAERKSKCLLNRRILEKEKPLRLEQNQSVTHQRRVAYASTLYINLSKTT
jgi:hypothetical protein